MRLAFSLLLSLLTTVSIHAPTRGATCQHCNVIVQHNCFNPRTHEGCDSLFYKLYITFHVFQSTHPRGVRPLLLGIKSLMFVSIHAPTRGATYIIRVYTNIKSFNPRTHEGGDIISENADSRKLLFQSTHPRGGRLRITQMSHKIHISFNPRTHEGGDCIFCKIQNINIQK